MIDSLASDPPRATRASGGDAWACKEGTPEDDEDGHNIQIDGTAEIELEEMEPRTRGDA